SGLSNVTSPAAESVNGSPFFSQNHATFVGVRFGNCPCGVPPDGTTHFDNNSRTCACSSNICRSRSFAWSDDLAKINQNSASKHTFMNTSASASGCAAIVSMNLFVALLTSSTGPGFISVPAAVSVFESRPRVSPTLAQPEYNHASQFSIHSEK